jgi:heavy metal translocating P-type ATPase
MLVSLLLAARLIDVMTRRSALKALRAMAEAAPEAAQRLTPQGPRHTPAAEIAVGDRVIVDAGETAAVDGVVVVGESLLNRAMLTGEAVPLAVAPGARIEAGAVNLSARLEIEVDRAFGDREIDHMGGAVALEIAEGGAEGGPAEAWAARLVRLIPLAAGLTILVGLALGRGMEMSLIQGLSLMVGVCPCALAIALPLVRLRTARLAAAAGARIREPAAFEALAHLRRIVFDKTGTLTEGTPQVVAVEPAQGVAEAALLTAAARAETGILHPIARAVTAHAGEIGPGGTRLDRGAEARDGQGALIRAETGRPGADGRARIRISRDGVELGQIVLADRLRPEAGAVLDRLRAEGLALEIATGDSAAPAQVLGAGLGFGAGDIHAGLTPRDKAALLRAGPRPVAFIGDGVNDGPALAAADCGLSIAAAHPAARQTAGVVIERGGIERLPGLVALSRRAAAIGRQNLTLAIAYNLCAIPAALAGLMRPEISAVAMAASSISILLNTLRLTGSDVAPPQAGPH